MHWLYFVLAIVIGGIIRAFYYQKQNKVIKVISFIVPFALAVVFWIKLYETGYSVTFFSTYVKGLKLSDQNAAKWAMITLTSCCIVGISWAFGAIISAIIDSVRNKADKNN